MELGNPRIQRFGSQFDGTLGVLREQSGGLTLTLAPDTNKVRLYWWVPRGSQVTFPQEIHVDPLGYRVVGSTPPNQHQMDWIVWVQSRMEP